MRECSRTGCGRPATASLTYVYAESTAVVGPLGPHREPDSYDLCADHAATMSAPRGWEVIRLPGTDAAAAPTPHDDLMALAQAVREVGMLEEEVEAAPAGPDPSSVTVLGRRGHLSVIADAGLPANH